MKSDWTTALAMLAAAREGALANVAINLDDLRERGAEIADLEAASSSSPDAVCALSTPLPVADGRLQR